MNLETAGAETPAGGEAASAEATPVVTPDTTTGQQSDAENNGAASAADTSGEKAGDDAAAAEPKKKHWAHERIDELTRQRREAERQADYWKQRAEAQSSTDYDSLEYEDQIAERVSARQRREMAESARNAAQSAAASVFEAREVIARETYADYDVVAKNPHVQISNAMAEVILDSDVGPELAYHLGKNPAEAARIAALPPSRQAAELGRLEAKISAPKALPKQPPTPVQPVGGNASSTGGDPSRMSMSEYIAWRKAN